jgi:hypothetical protein
MIWDYYAEQPKEAGGFTNAMHSFPTRLGPTTTIAAAGTKETRL